MHACLQISEIQEHIISYAPRHTNVQLAVTCRAFYDPAMDAVWAHVCDFAPLVRCMPADVWAETSTWVPSNHGSNVEVSLKREPTSKEWLAFRKHVHRVRKFDTEADTMSEITKLQGTHNVGWYADVNTLSIVSRHICDAQAQEPLFPNLKHLFMLWVPGRFQYPDGSVLRCVPFLAGSSLCVFELRSLIIGEMSAEAADAVHVLLCLATCSPAIRQVKTKTKSMDVASSILVRLPRLEEVDVKTSDLHTEAAAKMLIHLGGLTKPGLGSLSVEYLDMQIIRRCEIPLHFTGPSFLSLKDLKLENVDCRWITSLLNAMSESRKLSTIELHLDFQTNGLDLGNLITAVSALTPLEALTVVLSTDIRRSRYTLSSKLMSRLHALHNLRTLSLHNFAQVQLTDSDLAALASAFPRLEQLGCTIGGFCIPRMPGPTLMGLAALRNACPSIHRIAMNVSSTLGPGISGCIPPNPQTLLPLELTIGAYSPSKLALEPMNAALVLSALFPRLSSFQYNRRCEYWTSVHGHLRKFLQVAANEDEDDNVL